jgi:hypothetical protein
MRETNEAAIDVEGLRRADGSFEAVSGTRN